MEAIATLTDPSIPAVLPPTLQAFIPLLQARKNDIESVTRKTFKYGSTDRHQLDVYYPPSSEKERAPVLFFEYGGGFNNGSRVQPSPADLLYPNIGAFFAKRGIYTVIADYRLVPEAKFPEAAEDVRDAVAWVVKNASDIDKSHNVKLDVNNIFLLGNSAGAVHIVTAVLLEGLFPDDLRPHLRGLISLGGAFAFPVGGPADGLLDVVRAYYGSDEQIKQNEPLALLGRASEGIIKSLPDLLVLRSEKEPGFIASSNETMLKELREKVSSKVDDDVLQGHNHISPSTSLSSGEGEEWGEKVASWVKSKL
ncbi:alpha/beta-hydrolase [Panus rudis PR-1116 ss-1]|nr:alpha/beta-hydrolase [Panus rudis PR-1116 ss-1]